MRFRAIILCLAATAVLAGCVSDPQPGDRLVGYSPKQTAQSRLRNDVSDYRRTVVEGVGSGIVLGALSGAMVSLASGNTRNIGRNALIGGVAGGVIGGGVGVSVAERKQQQIAEERALDGQIDQLRDANRKLASVIRSTDELIAQRRSEIASLKKADATGRTALRRSIEEDEDLVSAALSKAERDRDALTGDIAARSNSDLGQSISRLERQRDTLHNLSNGL